jgi:tRNA threonylcarbamoyladenosine modification (KEOPS) complex Cgi121 subunit
MCCLVVDPRRYSLEKRTKRLRMKSGVSRLYELQPDPYDVTQRRYLRVCIFRDVKNAMELSQMVRKGEIDAALVKAEMVAEPFILLAAANRAIHQAAHNRMYTRSLAAELIYSLSPTRNITESLTTFGINDNSQNLVVAIFDDDKGSKMVKLAKKIDGAPVTLEHLREIIDIPAIKKVYHVCDPALSAETISDLILTRIVAKDVI